MANEIFPDEGLDYMLGVFPKNGTNLATSYLLLFTSQTATTTPPSTAVLATSTNVTEAAYTGYARQSIAAASWGSATADTVWSQAVRRVTAAQVSFPAATAASSTAINGFGLATASTAGIGLFYSNFDDTTAVATLAIGDIIRVTPKFGLGG